MDKPEKSDKPGLSLASTIMSAVADKVEATLANADWVLCVVCRGEYRMDQMADGLCKGCEFERYRAEMAAKELRTRIVKAVGGEKAYTECTVERFEVSQGNRAAYEAARQFDPKRNNLYLWGPCGTGKSHLASIIGRSWAERIDVLFIEPAPLLRSLRGHPDAQSEQRMIDSYVRTPLLILDDLGIERDTEFAISALSEIISHRLKANRNGLVITSNLGLGELAKKLGDDRLTSRIAGACEVIELVGADHRLLQADV